MIMNDMQKMINRFFEWMGVKNYSRETIVSWRLLLKYFNAWCEERDVIRPQDVTRPLLERYQRFLFHYINKKGQRLNVNTRHNRLIPVRAFFKWLAKNNYILFNPAGELELPRLEYRLPRNVLTRQEAETILNGIDLTTPMGLRDRAMLETLYSTGMRRTELCNLKLNDINMDKGIVMICEGKYKKDRVIPIGERAVLWIEKYLHDLRPLLCWTHETDRLFLTRHGKPMRPKHLTRIAHGHVKNAEIGKTGSNHIWRHSCATLMLENGADIRYVQEQLGHASIDTTKIYTRIAIVKLKEVHTQTHPASNILPQKPEEITTYQ